MADTGETKSMNLSLRLLREGVTVEKALRTDHDLQEQPADPGRLFTGQALALPPDWTRFIDDFATGDLPRLVNQSCAAVLFLDVEDGRKRRTFVLSFGQGHHSLEPDAFERNFGLRVVLNAVARSNLRGVDVATLDATTFQKRIQASRDADLQGFGIDVDRDLMQLVAGSPKDPSFARTLAGKDALMLATKTSPSDVAEKCKIALKFYQATDYKADFGFIDFVSPVKQKTLLDTLNDLAFDELQELVKGEASDLHLALPDILSPEEGLEIGYYGVGLKPGAKQSYSQVSIEDYVAELQAGSIADISNMEALKASHEIRVVANGEGDKRHKRKVYDCFVYEVEHNGSVYVLYAGDWYAVDKAFHEGVEERFNALVSKHPFVASTAQTNERNFIAELDANAHLLNLDQVKLSPTGAPKANLEPCDFLSTRKQFIHLKDGHSSAPISHLWNQGVVAAESFVSDEKFRIDLRKEIKKRQKKGKKKGFEDLVPDGRSKPTPGDYTVVFGIMREPYKKSGTLGLPFFSKVSLRAVADRIRLMGYSVEVHLIAKR